MAKFQSSLSPAVQCQLEGLATVQPADNDGRNEVEQFRQKLPMETIVALDQMERGEEEEMVEAARPCYCMVESPEGEFPLLRIFSTVNGLVDRIRSLEGKDVCVYPFWGIPLPLTQGPGRALILPGKTVRISDGKDVGELPDDAALQEDGFLGLPELSISPPSYIKEDVARAEAVRNTQAKKAKDDDDDDDDEVFGAA